MQLLAGSENPQEVAAAWLSVSPQNTFPFGVEKGERIFLNKLWDEVEAFLCGDPKYESDRQKLEQESNITHTYFVGVVSAAIAPTVGSSGVFLAPVIAIILMSMGKITINAWCKLRQEIKESS